MIKHLKRGLSPVIATVLLISLALILAVIVFLWARGFIEEKIQKFGEPIERACEDVSFSVDVDSSNNEIKLTNMGTVPLYGVEIRKKNDLSGVISKVGTAYFDEQGSGTDEEKKGIPKGSEETAAIDFEGSANINPNEIAFIIPILLGETEEFKKSYVCDEKFREEVVVL